MKDTTQTRIALLENNHNLFMEQFKAYSEENTKQHNEIKEMITVALEKKADKDSQWAEGVLKWFGVLAGSGILAYIGSIIIKAIEKL